MLTRLAKLTLVVTLACAIGLHWFVLQSVAWTTMLADNLRHDPIGEAVSRTFDGNHRCSLCKAIAAAKGSEKKPDFTPQSGRLEFPPAPSQVTPTAPSHFILLPAESAFAALLTAPPPTPPPRSNAA